ncbi:bifunctional adenosylcobinamide kinase/adenosylcobinamide-phosphate guanylyltransferase [Billgrantia saliphila]|uniref:bifunctional adenosylcobinamide kinase/adenosylcobinamide-phosphate guanylyltransferase n=1 Tax=Billgrantia saliphila TaxID=1848458 RepID=UPI000CE45B52|nr:bifunctional adenosylcobinamide kinase/adenosylcobinamide-phosphate guanylyltransferase [Halomonas saliphila]
MIAFISGGARSGKSAHAEALACRWQARRGGKRYYLATAQASDGEMQQRIARHRDDRGEGWTTLEAPIDLLAALTRAESGATLLLDCLTLWASQWLYAGPNSEQAGLDMIEGLLAEARRRDIALVIVSNDINEGMPPENDEVWRYLAFLQRIHRLVAREADTVIQVAAGLPQVWKGRP